MDPLTSLSNPDYILCSSPNSSLSELTFVEAVVIYVFLENMKQN